MNTSIKNILKKWEHSLERYNKIDNWSFNENLSNIGKYLRSREDDRTIVSTVRQIRDNVISPFFKKEEVLRLIKLLFSQLEIQESKELHMMTKSSWRREKSHGQKVLFKGETNKIFEERLKFKNGMLLRNFDIETESAYDSRKVRRIVEKRMCQAYHKMHRLDHEDDIQSNKDRYWKKRATAFQLYNIGQIENAHFVSRGRFTHWKKAFDPLTGEIVLKKKMAYPNMESALEAIEKWKVNHPYDKREMHAYECCICHKWHIGHSSEIEESENTLLDKTNSYSDMYCAC